MSSASNSQPAGRRSVRLAVILASSAVALCFVAAFGLVQQPLKAQTTNLGQTDASQDVLAVATNSPEHPAD